MTQASQLPAPSYGDVLRDLKERLSRDLRTAFPEMKGFSRTNLLSMRVFAEAHPDEAIVQQAAGLIPWFHNCILPEGPEEKGQTGSCR
jgi:hypothetical protein